VLAVRACGDLDLDRTVPGGWQARRASAQHGEHPMPAFDLDAATVTTRSPAQVQSTHARRQELE
jgi:hypothetical protein